MQQKYLDTIGSPVLHPTISDIADGAFETIDLNEPNSRYAKYIPFDFIEITNSSALFLTLTLNDEHTFALPGNVSVVKTDLPFRRFRINNDSGALLTGTDVFISVQHTPLTEDKVIRRPQTFSDKVMKAIPFLGFMR